MVGGYPVPSEFEGPEDDPDREINPIILQFMAKSTLKAVLTDKNALKSTMDKRGMDANASQEELAEGIFSKMKEERLARVRELQRQFLMFLMGKTSDSDNAQLLKDVFLAFVQAIKEQKEESLPKESGWKKIKSVKSQPDFGRLMKGLRPGEEEETKEGSLMGAVIQVLDFRDQRSSCIKGLKITGESSKGQAWELSDGSYVNKDQEGLKWKIVQPPKPSSRTGSKESTDKFFLAAEQTTLKSLKKPLVASVVLSQPKFGSTTATVMRRRPSVPELHRKDRRPSEDAGYATKLPRPSSNSALNRLPARRRTIE